MSRHEFDEPSHPASPPAPVPAASRVIGASTSIHCARCGYDLTGSAVGGWCPECGTAVAESLRGVRCGEAGGSSMGLATAGNVCALIGLILAGAFWLSSP